MSINFGDPHFTTVNGVNFNYEIPGAFLLMKSSLVTAQVLQIPCNNRVSCRRMSEIAVRAGSFVLSIKYTDLETAEALLLESTTEAALPEYTSTKLRKSKEYVNLPSSEKLKPKYRWLTPDILEVVFDEKEKLHILVYNGTLGAAFELSSEKRIGTHGLCGESTGKWITSMQGNQSKPNATKLSQAHIDKNLSSQLRVNPEDIVLTSPFAKLPFTAAGFMMQFTQSHLSLEVTAASSFPVLEEFTFELWACLVDTISSISELCLAQQTKETPFKHTVIKTKVGLLSVSSTKSSNFAVLYDKGIKVVWNDQEARTTLTISEGVWTHLSITWRSNDGRVQIITATNKEVDNATTFGIQLGKTFVVDGSLVLGRYMNNGEVVEGYDLRGALDELRVWQYARTKQETGILRYSKFDHYYLGLLMSLPFDEGYGRVVAVGCTVLSMSASPIRIENLVMTEEEKLLSQYIQRTSLKFGFHRSFPLSAHKLHSVFQK